MRSLTASYGRRWRFGVCQHGGFGGVRILDLAQAGIQQECAARIPSLRADVSKAMTAAAALQVMKVGSPGRSVVHR